MFEFMRLSGGRMISILDLVKLCCFFTEDSCKFGAECDLLMQKYKQLNIEPKYVHEMTEFGFQQYMKYVPFSCLIADLEYAFVGQIQARIHQVETMSDDNRRNDHDVEEFPLIPWKMSAIFDERDQGDDYRQALDRRTGKTGQKEYEAQKQKNNKIDRGYDIINTWKIKSKYLN